MIYAISLIGLVLRLILIGQSFWLDEAASLVISNQTLSNLIPSLASDFHPPLYYLFTRLWLVLGYTSEAALRLPTVILSTLNIYFLYQLIITLGKSKKVKQIALVSATLLAINPLHIYYSQELRMYSASALLVTLSWLSLLRLKSKSLNFWFYLLTIFNILSVYTFYGTFFIIATQAIYIFKEQPKLIKQFFYSCVILALFFLPWIPILSQQIQGSSLLTNLAGWSTISGTLTLKSLVLIPVKFVLGRINLSTNTIYTLSAASILIYLFAITSLSLKQKIAKVFLYWLLTPLVIASFISLRTPVLGYWRYIYLVPAFTTLIAIGLVQFPKKLKLTNLVVIIITFLAINSIFWINRSFHREDWRSATSFVDTRESSDLVVFAFSDAFAPVRWYAPNLDYVAPLINLNQADKLDEKMSIATKDKTRIFYFEYLKDLTDPNGNIPHWLENAGYTQVGTHDFSGVGFVHEYQGS